MSYLNMLTDTCASGEGFEAFSELLLPSTEYQRKDGGNYL